MKTCNRYTSLVEKKSQRSIVRTLLFDCFEDINQARDSIDVGIGASTGPDTVKGGRFI